MSNYPPSQPPGQPPGNYPPPPPGYPGGPPQGWQGPPPGWQGAPPPGYYGQPPRKSNKGLIIGLVIGVVLLISIGVAFWFLVIRTHSGPVTVAANLMTSLNPDLEIVSVDEEKELITFKEKKSGKVFTITLKEAQGGKITIKGDGGEEVSVEGKDDGSGGSVNIKSKEGTVTF
ncbi:MAG TPA: hypothetical protein VID27_06380, partial [Blastocatellia bacterium]